MRTRAFTSMMAAAFVLSVTYLGCGTESAPSSEPVDGVTYHGHIAPLLATHCSRCHSGAEILAPFTFDSYAEAAPLAELIAFSTTSRRMPPFPADNSGSCGKLEDPHDAWLSEEAIATFAAWAEAGAPEGDPSTAAAIPPVQLAGLDRIDATVDSGAAYVPTPPEGKQDDYRCFVTEPVAADDKYIVAYEAKPTVLATAHHFVLFIPNSEEAAAQAVAADAADTSQPGYSCFGSAGVSASVGVVWGPGTGALRLPEGTGVLIPGGRRLIIQMHYNVTSDPQPTRTIVDLRLEDTVETPLVSLSVGSGHPGSYTIPAGESGYGVTIAETVEKTALFKVEEGVTLYSVVPHMHLYGKELHAKVRRAEGGEDVCLLRVPRWDFNWQFMYDLETPVWVSKDDELEVRCVYDTSAAPSAVEFGEGSGDEMCFAMFLVGKSKPSR